jgi:hypothetical protein
MTAQASSGDLSHVLLYPSPSLQTQCRMWQDLNSTIQASDVHSAVGLVSCTMVSVAALDKVSTFTLGAVV